VLGTTGPPQSLMGWSDLVCCYWGVGWELYWASVGLGRGLLRVGLGQRHCQPGTEVASPESLLWGGGGSGVWRGTSEQELEKGVQGWVRVPWGLKER
jgi:hypothetical protein